MRGGNENTGEFNLDTFKQNIVDTYNKVNNTSITTDNVIMPDAFIMYKNYSPGLVQYDLDMVDTDLTQFLASSYLDIRNIIPMYLEDSLIDNDSNLYFGFGETKAYKLDIYNNFVTYDVIPDNFYNGSLDLSKYVYLFPKPSS